MIAYGFTVLVMRRSILTEKVSRRGFHLTREYATDPLAVTFVREVMRTNVAALEATLPLRDLAASVRRDGTHSGQRLYPVVDADGRMIAIATRHDLGELAARQDGEAPSGTLGDIAQHHPTVAYADEPLTAVAYRMADSGFTRMPVVARDDHTRMLGIISLKDLLSARLSSLDEERVRERTLRVRTPFSRSRASIETTPVG
jgi:CBS domain-containing protein